MGYKELLDEFKGKDVEVQVVSGKEIIGNLAMVRDTHLKIATDTGNYFIKMDKVVAFKTV